MRSIFNRYNNDDILRLSIYRGDIHLYSRHGNGFGNGQGLGIGSYLFNKSDGIHSYGNLIYRIVYRHDRFGLGYSYYICQAFSEVNHSNGNGKSYYGFHKWVEPSIAPTEYIIGKVHD